MSQALMSPPGAAGIVGEVTGDDQSPSRPRSRFRSLTDPASTLPVYLGIVLLVVGFVLLFLGWSNVAGTLNVALQLPYLMSAGLPGLALVMLGLVVINVSVRRQDGAERARQLSALTEALQDLQQSTQR